MRNKNSMFIAKVLRKLKLKKVSCKFNEMRHSKIEANIFPLCDVCIKKIASEVNENISSSQSNYVWIFWWQGKNNMPDIVQKCYNSLLRNFLDKEVVLITKDNIRKYCTLPEYIYEKCRLGEITLTHLSDIVRFDLLLHYGGLYTDATVFWAGNLAADEFSEFYTCGGYKDEYSFCISKGRWTGFLIGGKQGNILFSFMYNFFLLYWAKYEELIDYFLIDYALDYAYRKNIGYFKEYIDHVAPFNNPNLFNLMEMRNKLYTKKGEKELMSETCAFKLSYKKKFSDEENTYAGQIVFKR